MTKFKNSKIILTLFIVLAFFLAQNAILLSFFGANLGLPMVEAAQSQGTHVGTLSLITNSTFNTTSSGSSTNTSSYYTGSSSIKTPSSWTKDLKSPYPSSLKMGVCDLSDNSKYSDYGLNSVGKTIIYTDSKAAETEHNALMINAETDRVYGFTSSSFELEASSFYSITVSCFTKTNSIASIFLKQSDAYIENDNSCFVDINTNQSWQTRTFWIETSSTEKLSSLKLYLCLGVPATSSHSLADCNGFVLFDNVIVKRYSKMAFTEYSAVRYSNATENQYMNFNHRYVSPGQSGFVQNGNFENGTTNWSVDSNQTSGNAFYTIVDLRTFEASEYQIDESFDPGTNYSADANQHALFVASTKKEGTIVVKSSPFTILTGQVYRISIWAKGNISKGDVKIMIAGTNPNAVPDDEDESSNVLSKTFTSLSTSSNAYTNYWNEYVFYVTGNPLYDCNDVYIALGLDNAIGYVVFDDIKTQAISSADKTSGTSVDKSIQSLNMFTDDSHTVKNANFNTFAETANEKTYPIAPASWDKADSSTTTTDVSGIVNTKTSYYNTYKANFGNPVNPGLPSSMDSSLDEPNNVLMMYNTYSSASYQTYETSDTVSLNSSSYYILSVDICTLSDITGLGGINITITTSDDIVIQKFENIRTNGQWKIAKIYISTSEKSQSVTISLSFGSKEKPVHGWAFFDNCELESSDEDAFNAATQNDLTVKTSIASDSTTAYCPTETTSNYLYTPLFYQSNVVEYTEPDSSYAGVLTMDNRYKFFNYQDYNLESTNDDVLAIKAMQDVYQTVTAKINFSFESGNYYKVTVDVKTIGLSQQESNKQYDVNGNVIPFGASIAIDGFDQKFTGINTAPETTTSSNPLNDSSNKFITYTFYINPTETVDGSLILSLGSQDALTSGYAFFDNVSIKKIDEDVYKNETATFEEEGIPETVISIVNNTQKSDDDDDSQAFGSAFDWYAIPTIIIAIAVVITVVGFLIRKHQNNRTEKVNVKVSYDRSETLLKDMDNRHRKSAINHRLKLLYEELEATEEALRKEKAEHEKQSNAYETAKEISQQDPSVQMEEVEVNDSFEETVEQLENNIEAIKADIKGLEMEKQKYIEKEKQRLEQNTNNTVTTRKVQRKKQK